MSRSHRSVSRGVTALLEGPVARLPSADPDLAARRVLSRAIVERFGVDIGNLDPLKVQTLLEALPAPGPRIDESSARAVTEAMARPVAEAALPSTRPGLSAIIAERVLLAGPRPLRVWVVGCATGGGPAELATVIEMLRGLPDGARVLGTDRDPVALQDVLAPAAPGVECWLRVLDPMQQDADFQADLVLCSGLMAQVATDRRAFLLERLRAALTDGGHLVLGPDDHVDAEGGMERRAVAALTVRTRPRTPARPEAVRARVASALALADARQSAAAMDRLRHWSAEDPAEPAYPTVAAEIALQEGDIEQALAFAGAAVRLAPDACTPAVLLAEARIGLGHPRSEQALEAARARLAARLPGAVLPLGWGMTASTLRLRLERVIAWPRVVEAAG